MTKSSYTKARIAQERTKQIMLVCLTLIGLSIAAIPVVKGVQSNAQHVSK